MWSIIFGKRTFKEVNKVKVSPKSGALIQYDWWPHRNRRPRSTQYRWPREGLRDAGFLSHRVQTHGHQRVEWSESLLREVRAERKEKTLEWGGPLWVATEAFGGSLSLRTDREARGRRFLCGLVSSLISWSALSQRLQLPRTVLGLHQGSRWPPSLWPIP